MERPIAYFTDDGRSWRCDGCGSYGSVARAANGRRHAARHVAMHVEECTPAETNGVIGQLVIRPGDTVLVRMPRSATPHQLNTVASQLYDMPPDVEVLMITGAEGIDVYRPEEADGPHGR
ncbi:hypothetical protein AB0903_31015 [Streptomyces sp. NPDC048389]|uniref:hypothetical protein n=1 Tax=Streptomyces sp. NPDC048389 TaxID=3154622 RepID=UPI0034513632